MIKDIGNINILLCRPEEQAKDDILYLNSLGFNVYILPTIKINEIKIKDFAIFNLKYDYLVLTSVNSVKYFFSKYKKMLQFDYLVCVGKKTAELCKKLNFNNIIVPEIHSSDGLIELFSNKDLKNKKILIPGSKISNPKLLEYLNSQNAEAKFIPVYDTCLPLDDEIVENLEKIKDVKIDFIIFSSPSTFENYLKIMKIENPIVAFKDIKIAAIGNVTKNRIEKEGIKVSITPNEFNIKSVSDEIYKYYKTMPEKI